MMVLRTASGSRGRGDSRAPGQIPYGRIFAFVLVLCAASSVAPASAQNQGVPGLGPPSFEVADTGINVYKQHTARRLRDMLGGLRYRADICDRSGYTERYRELEAAGRAPQNAVQETTPTGGGVSGMSLPAPFRNDDYAYEAEVLVHDKAQIRRILAMIKTPSQVAEDCSRLRRDENASFGDEAPAFLAINPLLFYAFLPEIHAGTVLNGTEEPLLASDASLHGAGFRLGFLLGVHEFFSGVRGTRPLFGDGPRMPPLFKFDFRYGRATGDTDATEPDGGRDVALTFLSPYDGITGVLLGNTGLRGAISSEAQAFDLALMTYLMVGSGYLDPARRGLWWLSVGMGLNFAYETARHQILLNSLLFGPDIATDTRLDAHQYFFGPQIALALHVQRAAWFMALTGFFAPGYTHAHGEAVQQVSCVVCRGLPDRFSIRETDSYGGFGFRTGINLVAGYYLTHALMIGFNGGYMYRHNLAGFRNPTTPREQPFGLVRDNGASAFVGIFLRWYFDNPNPVD